MAERNEQVLDHVRSALQKNPALTSTELYESAQQIDPSIGDESLRSFHARYVLSLKRSSSGGRGGGRKSGRKAARGRKGAAASGTPSSPPTGARRGRKQREAEAERTRVRGVFLQFAREVAGAETRAEVVNVVGSVDRYVDEVLG